MSGVDGRAWIDAQPAALAAHAEILRRLLLAAEADGNVRALELQCSVARGAGDELSDLDAGLWVADAALEDLAARLPEILARLAEPLDALSTRRDGRPYFFVQYASGVQLDLLVLAASTAKGRVRESIVLLDRDGLLREPYEPEVATASAADLEDWSFQAWLALANLAKYLRRRSLWEAWTSLEEARANLLRLHAARLGVRYPAFGLTSLLDDPATPVPPGLERTTARLDEHDLRRAALACADQLQQDERPLAALVRARLGG